MQTVDPSKINLIPQFLVDKIMANARKAAAKAEREIWPYQMDVMRDIYDDAVYHFYADYTPTVYERKYSLFNGGADGDGLLDVDDEALTFWFESDNITPTRGGDHEFIYDIVFHQGYHGGNKDHIWPWVHDKAEKSKPIYSTIEKEYYAAVEKKLQPKMNDILMKHMSGMSLF